MALAPRLCRFGHLKVPFRCPLHFRNCALLTSPLLFIEGGYLLFDILLLSGGVPGRPPGDIVSCIS